MPRRDHHHHHHHYHDHDHGHHRETPTAGGPQIKKKNWQFQKKSQTIRYRGFFGIFFDTADLYDKGVNEEIVGEVLKEKRQDVIIATKVGNQWRDDGSGWEWNPTKSYIKSAVHQSLRRLQTDYIDLYQLHGGTIDDPMDETIQAFGEEITGVLTTPAGSNLMKVPGQDEELDEEQVKRFHSVVAKLLYLMKRARPDLEPTISFLCTRVSKCVRSDWEKLRRALCYVKNTINDVQIIGAENMMDMYTWVDASYAIHDNMRGHTGGCMSLGHGVFHAKSSKQKINTKKFNRNRAGQSGRIHAV